MHRSDCRRRAERVEGSADERCDARRRYAGRYAPAGVGPDGSVLSTQTTTVRGTRPGTRSRRGDPRGAARTRVASRTRPLPRGTRVAPPAGWRACRTFEFESLPVDDAVESPLHHRVGLLGGMWGSDSARSGMICEKPIIWSTPGKALARIPALRGTALRPAGCAPTGSPTRRSHVPLAWSHLADREDKCASRRSTCATAPSAEGQRHRAGAPRSRVDAFVPRSTDSRNAVGRR